MAACTRSDSEDLRGHFSSKLAKMTSEVLIRRALLTAGALLALFHVWLFAGQAWNGHLADPALLLRWLFAGGLVAALVGLRRQGTSIFRGRKAVAIWVLAALLHGPAVARRIDRLGEPALPEFVVTLDAAGRGVQPGADAGVGVRADEPAPDAAPRPFRSRSRCRVQDCRSRAGSSASHRVLLRIRAVVERLRPRFKT